jgi:hypothetical protein
VFLKATSTLIFLQGQMVFICNGNYHFKVWMGYIDRLHKMDRSWYISVDSICFETKGKIGA